MRQQRFALPFIFITVLADMIGIGIIIPVIPALIEQLTGQVSGAAAIYGMWLLVAFAGMQFLFSPVMGELSDRFGRRPVLLLALLGLSIDYLFHALAPTLAWLYLGRVLAGITGATHSVAYAYMADISTKENKAKHFGYLGAAFGLGFIIGPSIGGIFGEIDPRLPFYIAAGFTFLNFIFGFFFLPESLPVEKRRSIDISKMIPGKALWRIGTFAGVGGLILALFFANLAGQSLPATWSFFTKEVLDWSEAEIGYSLSFVGVLVSVTQALLVGRFVARFGARRTIKIGFIFWTIGMSLFAFAGSSMWLYLFCIPYCLGGLAGPTLRSMLSDAVSGREQGILQGSLTSMTSITTILGPVLASTLFYQFTEGGLYFPGAPYLAGGLLLATSSVIVFLHFRRVSDV